MRIAIQLLLCYYAVTLALPSGLTDMGNLTDKDGPQIFNFTTDSSGSTSDDGLVQQAVPGVGDRRKRDVLEGSNITNTSLLELAALDSPLDVLLITLGRMLGMNDTANVVMYVRSISNIVDVEPFWSWLLSRVTSMRSNQQEPRATGSSFSNARSFPSIISNWFF